MFEQTNTGDQAEAVGRPVEVPARRSPKVTMAWMDAMTDAEQSRLVGNAHAEALAEDARRTAGAPAPTDSRDTCPGCGSVTEPNGKTDDGRWSYRCPCGGDPVEWTAYSPADCANLA